jgi:hypothetical protein
MKTESVSIQHRFDDKDLAELARDQARAHGRKSTLELELKSVVGDYKARVAQAAAEMSSLSARINSGFEMRSIDCMIADEREEGYRFVIRLDNGHITRRRKLAPEERQIKLTETPPEQYMGAAILPVDDESWEVENYLVRLFADEFDVLRKLPDVKMTDWKPAPALTSGNPPPKKKKADK